MLQWGHDFSVMEMLIERTIYRFVLARLQWGHDFSVMEMQHRMIDDRPCGCCFNGAMTFQSWKWRPFCGLYRVRKRSVFREDGGSRRNFRIKYMDYAPSFGVLAIVSSASLDSRHHLTSRSGIRLLLLSALSQGDAHPEILSYLRLCHPKVLGPLSLCGPRRV